MKIKDLVIKIDNGEMFEGTLDQFKENYFSNANISTIKEWCKKFNYDCLCIS